MIRDEIYLKECSNHLKGIVMNLTSFTVKALAVTLVLASTSGVALAKHHKAENYKGEANYKGEVAPCPPPAMLKDGFYLGAQVGYDSYRVREGFASHGVSFNPVVAPTGWVGGLFVGYGQYLTDLFYLGGEIFGNVSGAEAKYSLSVAVPTGTATASSKVQVNNNYGLALLPGVRLNDGALGYLRLGWNWASIKTTNSVFVPAVGAASGSNTKTANGFDLGVGIEALVYENWSVRTEYSHTWFNNVSTGLASYKPSDNQFLLSGIYHFA
jgi:outer membrane immunogenic protein